MGALPRAVAAIALSGCIWTHRSNPGAFVTDLKIEGTKLTVERCELLVDTEHVAAYVVMLPMVVGGEYKSRSTGRGDCTSHHAPLPVGIFPGDGVDRAAPPWCQRPIERWRKVVLADREAEQARLQAALDATRAARQATIDATYDTQHGACVRTRIDGMRRAQALSDTQQRGRLLRSLPRCDEPRPVEPRTMAPLPINVSRTPRQEERWSWIAPACRGYLSTYELSGGSP
jgi:hypothetical protein